MTTGETPERNLSTADRLVAEVVGLKPGATFKSERTAILSRLRDEGFVPDARAHEAIAILARRSPLWGSNLQAEAHRIDEKGLRGEVAEFAAKFFALSVADRRARWRALMKACASHDDLRIRLRNLKPGLRVDLASVHDRSPEVERLASLAAALFVLPPGERAARRREHVSALRPDLEHEEKVRTWSRAAKRLKRRFPAIATLEPDLLESLKRPHTKRVAQLRPAPVPWSRRWWVATAMLLFGGFGVFKSFDSNSQPRLPTPPTLPPRLLRNPPPPRRDFVRDSIRTVLAKELKERGKPLSDAKLQQAVNDLPDTAIFVLPLLTGPKIHRDDEHPRRELRRVLAKQGVTLDDRELDEIARRCLPRLWKAKPAWEKPAEKPVPF